MKSLKDKIIGIIDKIVRFKDEIKTFTNIILVFVAIVSLLLSYHIFRETNKITHITTRPRMHMYDVRFTYNDVNTLLKSDDRKFYTYFKFKNIGKTEARNVKMTIISTQDKNFKTTPKSHLKESNNVIQPGQAFSERRINEFAYLDLEGIKNYFKVNNKTLPASYYYIKLEYNGEDDVYEDEYCQEFWVETEINKDLAFSAVLTSTKQTSSFEKLIDNRCKN